MFSNNDDRTSSRKKLILLALVLSLLGASLIATAAFADTKLTRVLRTWDDNTNSWKNSLIRKYLDGSPQSFQQKLDFDAGLVQACDGSAPGGGTQTKWAGQLVLDHDSLNSAGVPGYSETSDWKIVKCSDLETPDVEVPGSELFGCTEIGSPPYPDQYGQCDILTKDDSQPAGGGGEKIHTTLRVSLDQTCDGNIDDTTLDIDDLCFWWQATPPSEANAALWNGNLSSSIHGDAGGEKTVNTKFYGPNAVSLLSFAAQPTPAGLPVGVVALLALGAVALFAAAFVFLRGFKA